jgi:polar amino acid transport system substrate-binding protein
MKRTVLAVLLALGCAPACAQQAAPRLYLTTETSAPYSMHDGERVVGIGTEMVRTIMTRAGVAYSIDVLPWKRAYTAALERPDACVFSTTRTPERESQFKWVGPIGEAEWVLMGRADRHLKLRNLEEARRYRIGTYNGDARDLYLRERGFDVDSAPNDLINPRKLMLGRIDLWAASFRRGSLTLARLGYADKLAPVLVFNRIRVYLACNRAVPDALVARMNGVVGAMEKDGTSHAIARKYEEWGLAR